MIEILSRDVYHILVVCIFITFFYVLVREFSYGYMDVEEVIASFANLLSFLLPMMLVCEGIHINLIVLLDEETMSWI